MCLTGFLYSQLPSHLSSSDYCRLQYSALDLCFCLLLKPVAFLLLLSISLLSWSKAILFCTCVEIMVAFFGGGGGGYNTKLHLFNHNPLLFQIYYHGDPIGVNVKINNTTSKIVKKIKISGEGDQQQKHNKILAVQVLIVYLADKGNSILVLHNSFIFFPFQFILKLFFHYILFSSFIPGCIPDKVSGSQSLVSAMIFAPDSVKTMGSSSQQGCVPHSSCPVATLLLVLHLIFCELISPSDGTLKSSSSTYLRRKTTF